MMNLVCCCQTHNAIIIISSSSIIHEDLNVCIWFHGCALVVEEMVQQVLVESNGMTVTRRPWIHNNCNRNVIMCLVQSCHGREQRVQNSIQKITVMKL